MVSRKDGFEIGNSGWVVFTPHLPRILPKSSKEGRLTGFGEVPPKLVNGSGTFVGKLSADGQSISWTLTWTGLTGAAQVAHIHFGQPQNTGTPVVFFCNGGNRPAACPDGPGHSGTNIHTMQFGAGEIRGQVAVSRGEPEDEN